MTTEIQDSDQIMANERTIRDMIEDGVNDLGIVESYVTDMINRYSDLKESIQSNPNHQWPEHADEHLTLDYWNTKLRAFNEVATTIELISKTWKEMAGQKPEVAT